MNPLLPITAGLGLVQGVANVFRQKNANKALDQLLSNDPTYQINPLAQQQLGTAQQVYNGRMAGAANVEANIGKNQADTMQRAQRGATDASQLLSAGSTAQDQSNTAYNTLGTQEAQNKYSLLENLNKAYGAMINEGDKVAQDKVRRFSDLASIRGQQQQNKTSALNGVFNGINQGISNALQISSLGKGGIGSLLGGNNSNQSTPNNQMQGYDWNASGARD